MYNIYIYIYIDGDHILKENYNLEVGSEKRSKSSSQKYLKNEELGVKTSEEARRGLRGGKLLSREMRHHKLINRNRDINSPREYLSGEKESDMIIPRARGSGEYGHRSLSEYEKGEGIQNKTTYTPYKGQPNNLTERSSSNINNRMNTTSSNPPRHWGSPPNIHYGDYSKRINKQRPRQYHGYIKELFNSPLLPSGIHAKPTNLYPWERRAVAAKGTKTTVIKKYIYIYILYI